MRGASRIRGVLRESNPDAILHRMSWRTYKRNLGPFQYIFNWTVVKKRSPRGSETYLRAGLYCLAAVSQWQRALSHKCTQNVFSSFSQTLRECNCVGAALNYASCCVSAAETQASRKIKSSGKADLSSFLIHTHTHSRHSPRHRRDRPTPRSPRPPPHPPSPFRVPKSPFTSRERRRGPQLIADPS